MIRLIFSILSGHYLPAAGPFVPSEAGSTVMRRIFWIRRFCSLRKREALEAAPKSGSFGVWEMSVILTSSILPLPSPISKIIKHSIQNSRLNTGKPRKKRQISTRSWSKSLPPNDTSLQILVTGFFAQLPGKLKIFLCGIFKWKTFRQTKKNNQHSKNTSGFHPWRWVTYLQLASHCAMRTRPVWAWRWNVQCAHKASHNGRCPTVQIELKIQIG